MNACSMVSNKMVDWCMSEYEKKEVDPVFTNKVDRQ